MECKNGVKLALDPSLEEEVDVGSSVVGLAPGTIGVVGVSC